MRSGVEDPSSSTSSPPWPAAARTEGKGSYPLAPATARRSMEEEKDDDDGEEEDEDGVPLSPLLLPPFSVEEEWKADRLWPRRPGRQWLGSC